MKKFFCLLFSMILMICSCAHADQHMEIQCVFTGSMEGRTVSFDFYEQDESFTALSNLFPEFALVMKPAGGHFSLSDLSLFMVGPEVYFQAIDLADTMLCSWLDLQECDTVTGVFCGDIMDRANEMCSCRFSLDDMETYFQRCTDTIQSDQDTVMIAAAILSFCCSAARRFIPENRQFICLKAFDKRDYLLLGIGEQDDLMLSISVDRTAVSDKHLLISWHEDGQYCFLDIRFRTKNDSFIVESSFCTGEKASFRNMINNSLFSESIIITNGTDHKQHFEYMFQSAGLAEPFIISGIYEKTGDISCMINASAQISGIEDEKVMISASLDQLHRNVSFSDKITVHESDEKESAGFMISAVSGITLLAAEILPVLPSDYQKLILNFLYK